MDWIVRPFNAVFFAVLAAFLLLLAAASLLLRGKSIRTKKIVLVSACLVALIGFFLYKYALSLDAEYDRLIADMDGFNWWAELPLHLCNVNMLLIPVAVLSGKRPLMGFCFFVGPMCALMALTMPTAGFAGYSLFLPRMLGYYGTHFMVLIEALALVTFGFFRPQFRDLPATLAAIFGITFCVFLIDLVLRRTGLCPHANYFFAMETEGNPVLNIFHEWIPYPFLYLLPCLAVLAAYMAIVMSAFAIARRKKKRE
ncbi:MAG: YwaF family protein [Clostridia bacterium]|nr:YwaF family protein [Clostridia bacterium]